MIRLPSTTYILQLILSAGTADVNVSYSDQTATAYTGGTQETAATATTQTICAAPAASTVRDIDYVSIQYKTTGGTVTVQKLNSSGSVTTKDIVIALLVGEQLNYTHGSGWCALDANGNRKEVTSSVFSGITVSGLTASQAVFTDANKALTSNAITGSGNVVMSASPTMTGTIVAAAANFSGTVSPAALVDISGASAGQIKFPATQNSSANVNTLDDYEEGTWTPTITFGGGNTGQTYAARVGTYTKIGNRVAISSYHEFTNKGSSTGSVVFGGLPFTTQNTTNDFHAGPFYFATLTLVSGAGVCAFGSNSTQTTLYQTVTGSIAALLDTNFTNTSQIGICIVYEAAT